MVYYFTSNAIDPPATIYVGKDKFENEELIKFGWDCDFHADNLSSAHVYLRLPPSPTQHRDHNYDWTTLPQPLLDDCAQLTKANSIEGNKKPHLNILYTPHPNLLKTAAMATGQVGFLNPHLTKTTHVPARLNSTINRLEKTRRVSPADELPAAKEAYLAGQRARRRAEGERRKKEEERVARERRAEKEGRERGYEELMRVEEGRGRSNEEGFDEEDFM